MKQTNLRALRLRYDIPLSELSAASGLSIQYVNRAELGELSPTPHLEDKMRGAMEAVIARRLKRIVSLGQSFAVCKGRLLQPEGGEPGE